MINIVRNLQTPNSLNDNAIKDYIAAAVQYLNNPTGQKPEKPTSYRNSDLLEAFDRDFYSKCYLTEQKYVNSWTLDVEHFIPQNERPDLVYEWTNLFPADHYTNMIKPRKTPNGGYLDPCNPNENVETEIAYTLSPFGEEPCFAPVNSMNIKAVNTCNLLDRVHNGHDYNTQKATEGLRVAIRKKHTEILNKIAEWQHYTEGSQEKFQAKRDLKDLLSRKSSFTMLCRSMPAVRLYVPNDFLD